jgi:uncharacterized protein
VVAFAFSWDPAKAASNRAKHGVTFETAMQVFDDPLALSRLDSNRDAEEERWITIGAAGEGLLLVVHTYVEWDDDIAAVRIISARRPTRREATQYAEG